jgi:D-citramalate synthase
MSSNDANRIEVMDTTLRDGEQTPDIAYTPEEKLTLARLLLSEVNVDRIEIASSKVSKGEADAARRISTWARKNKWIERVEILGYADGESSVNWIMDVKGKVLNLLTKGSENHCRGQLGISPKTHRERVAATLAFAKKRRLVVNAYLEDWSSGVREGFDYVFAMVEVLRQGGVKRVYLPDTLGIFSPRQTQRYVELMVETWPDVHFEYHAHNDYGLATANCLVAVEAGARGVHTSVNGMGERAGNARLAEIVAALHDQTDFGTGVDETRLSAVSNMVQSFSGKDMPGNTPIVGRDVYTQTAGIHADGDAKGNLYQTRLAPERFGRKRRYALGKLSGKASLDHNLKELGLELPDSDRDLVLRRIIELGDKKHTVVPEDLPYIIADVLQTPQEQRIEVQSWRVNVATGEHPSAEVTIAYRGVLAKAQAEGDGGYDAFMNALKKAVKTFSIEVPRLADYRVRIPPGGRTEALVETVISWAGAHGDFKTLGVDPDQMGAAVIATEKMLNLVAGQTGGKPPRPD